MHTTDEVERGTREVSGQVAARPVKVMFLEITLKIGGAERLLGTLLETFDRGRVQPVVALLGDPGPVAEQLRAKDVPVYHNLANGRTDPRLLPALMRVIRKERPDIIYTCNFPLTMYSGRLAGFLTGVNKHVVALHSIGYLARARWRAFSLRMMRPFIARCVAVSEGQKSYYSMTHGLDPGRTEVIYVGVDTERFSRGRHDTSAKAEFGIPEESPVVGIVAVLRPEKNHELFLRMAKRVVEAGKDTHFLIVGDGPERERLEQLARDLGLADCVHFAGARSDVPRMLRIMDVSILCSANVVETFPQSLVESMAMSLPVVSTGVGSIDEVIVDGVTGYLTPEGDVGALSERVSYLLSHPEKAREMGEAGRARAEEAFSKEIMTRQFEDLFASLVDNRKAL